LSLRASNGFGFLHRHLEQALAIGVRLGTLGAMRQTTEELLDNNPHGILLLDERKRIVFANRAIRALEADHDGIGLGADGAGGVAVPDKQDNDRLHALIDQALAATAVGPGANAVRARRPSGKRPYGILVGPVSRKYSVLSGLRPAVCIVITDPERSTYALKARLRTIFGLTEAEARLAGLLADGANLRDAASKLNVTYGTGRARLAQVFQKTETRSQAELVALLLKMLPAWLEPII
jgi:DNA-binding CsgD family transcriptional regulator